jgi:hypothetical protein
MRILVADDSDGLRMFMRRIWDDHEIIVDGDGDGDGDEALRLMRLAPQGGVPWVR